MAKKPEPKKEAKKETPIKIENPDIGEPESEAKPENPNIKCNFCGYTVAKLNNEALIGTLCPKCKKNGKFEN